MDPGHVLKSYISCPRGRSLPASRSVPLPSTAAFLLDGLSSRGGGHGDNVPLGVAPRHVLVPVHVHVHVHVHVCVCVCVCVRIRGRDPQKRERK